MKLFQKSKDGGPKSKVWGYWLIEWKVAFSIVLLRFEDGSREAYHEHAFNAVSWVLMGRLEEHRIDGQLYRSTTYRPSLWPVWTPRSCFHKVTSVGRTWVLSFRGPWALTWDEFDEATNTLSTLTHGRKVIP